MASKHLTGEHSPLFLAIDVGSQSMRGAIINTDGDSESYHGIDYSAQLTVNKASKAVMAEWFYEHLQVVIKQLLQQAADNGVNVERITSVSLTTFRNSIVLLDKNKQTITPLSMWSVRDKAKNIPQLSWYWRLCFSLANIAMPIIESLQKMQSDAAINHMMEQDPELFDKTEHLLLISGYLHFRLTGAFIDSQANIVGYVPFNYRLKRWYSSWAWQFQALRVKSKWFCMLKKPGDIIKDTVFLSNNLAMQAGGNALEKPHVMKLIAGAADKTCELLGAGCVNNGQVHLSLGSAITVSVLTDKFIGPKPLFPAYPSFTDDLYICEVLLDKGLILFTEFIHVYGDEISKDLRLNHHTCVLESLIVYMQTHQIDCADLIFDLEKAGQGNDFQQCFNQSISSFSLYELFLAMTDALVLGIDDAIKQLEKRLGKSFSNIHVSGGGSHSDWLLNKVSERSQVNLMVSTDKQPGVLGAAIISAVGMGVYKDYTQATANMVKPGKLITYAQHHSD